jgi:hypothetical protein
LGSKLEQARKAAFVFGFVGILGPPEKPPGGIDPPALPFGGAPNPKEGEATPCFFRQLSKFLIDDLLDFFVEVLDDAEATLPLAANTDPERARASNAPEAERYLEDRFIEVVVLVMATVWRANLDDR